jgi:hypothetical protein
MIFLNHEGKAHKGPDEVCSFLLKYINENIPSSAEETLFCLLQELHIINGYVHY